MGKQKLHTFQYTCDGNTAEELVNELGLIEFTSGTRTSEVVAERWWATHIQTVNDKGEWQWPK